MQSVEYLCSILHELDWQCAGGPSVLAELHVWIGKLQTREHFILETRKVDNNDTRKVFFVNLRPFNM